MARVEVLDGGVGLAAPGPQKAAEKPGRREIRIEHERPVEQGDAAVEVAGEMGERMPAAGERDRIVPAQLDGAARQTGALGDLPVAIGHPAIDLAPEIAPRRHRIGRREIRVELDAPGRTAAAPRRSPPWLPMCRCAMPRR